MNNQIAILEDKRSIAEKYAKHMKLKDVDYEYLESIEDVRSVLLDQRKQTAYIIDLNLGSGREEEGIEAIEEIRRYDPFAFIIVYSGNTGLEEKSLDVGADRFITKDQYKKNINKFCELITKYFMNSEMKLVTEIPAKFTKCDDMYFYVNCMVDEELKFCVEKKFPLSSLSSNFPDFYLGMPIMIQIKQGSNRICHFFNWNQVSRVNDSFKALNNNKIEDIEKLEIF